MKKCRSTVYAAEETTTAEDVLKNSLDVLEDDFEFLLAGVEKVSRTDTSVGQSVVDEVSDALQSAISQLAMYLQDTE